MLKRFQPVIIGVISALVTMGVIVFVHAMSNEETGFPEGYKTTGSITVNNPKPTPTPSPEPSVTNSPTLAPVTNESKTTTNLVSQPVATPTPSTCH